MKAKKYLIAVAIFGGMFFLAQSTISTEQKEEHTLKVEKAKLTNRMVAEAKVEKAKLTNRMVA